MDPKIELLKEKLKAAQEKLGAMRSAIDQEKRDPNTAEVQAQNDMLDEMEAIQTKIALEQRVIEQQRALATPVTEPVKPEPKSRIEMGEDRDGRKKVEFMSFGEQLQAVRSASRPGGVVDPRLLLIEQRAASGLAEGTNSDGGFLVQTDFAQSILQNVWDAGAIPSRLNRIVISGNANGMTMNGLDETSRADGSRAGGIQSYWTGEADAKTGSKPKFRQIELKLNKLTGLCYATDELLADAAALDAVVTNGFNKEFDFKITDGVINGTGVGQPLGIMNSGCLVSVAKEGGQANDTIVYENIVKMWSRLMAASRPTAVWLINQDCEPQLHTMSLAVGTGGVPVYLPAGGAAGSPYSTLYGRPVLPLEQCSTVGDLGDIVLADFSNYLFIDKGGMKKDVSIHVRFVYDESVFRFVYRCDGQPVLASAVTPYKGTNTLSHFVTLAAR